MYTNFVYVYVLRMVLMYIVPKTKVYRYIAYHVFIFGQAGNERYFHHYGTTTVYHRHHAITSILHNKKMIFYFSMFIFINILNVVMCTSTSVPTLHTHIYMARGFKENHVHILSHEQTTCMYFRYVCLCVFYFLVRAWNEKNLIRKFTYPQEK